MVQQKVSRERILLGHNSPWVFVFLQSVLQTKALKTFVLDCLFEDVRSDSEEKPWGREYVYVSLQSGGQATAHIIKIVS